MRTIVKIALVALAVAGCDVFLDDVGDEGEPCLDDGTCVGELVCNAEGICAACVSDCSVVGDSRCDGAILQRCADHGACLMWERVQDCAALEQVCIWTGTEHACCQPDCTNRVCGPDPVCQQSCGTCTAPATCNPAGQCVGCESNCISVNTLRCDGDRLERCTDVDGCLIWSMEQDCSVNSLVCVDSGAAACVPPCTPDCTQGTANRCEAHLSLEACDPDPLFPACFRWQRDFCQQDENCRPCDRAGFNTLCDEGSGDCVCAIPCGTDGRTCCGPEQHCKPGENICDTCALGETPCLDECCGAMSACIGGACSPCPASGMGCGPSCCLEGEVCTDRVTGTCTPCTGGAIPCLDRCCGGEDFCLQPGTCGPCPNTVCHPGGVRVCCAPGDFCDASQSCHACLPENDPCTAGDQCCGPDAACVGGKCQVCAPLHEACGDRCCDPDEHCVGGMCLFCDPATQGPFCLDRCCGKDQICSDPVLGTCEDCNLVGEGDMACISVCCDTTADQFCVGGQCGPCPFTSCWGNIAQTYKVCCGEGGICAAEGGCCDTGCAGLPCGPAPHPGCGVALCGPSGGQECPAEGWSCTLGGADQEQGNFNIPSVALKGTNFWALTWSNTRWGLLFAGFDPSGALLGQYLLQAGANPTGAVVREDPSDGGLIVAGYADAWEAGTGNGGMNMWLVKPSADLASVTWNKVYGTQGDDQARDLQPLPPQSPGYVVAGSSIDGSLTSGLVMRVAMNGSPVNPILIHSPGLDKDFALAASAVLVDGGSLTGFVVVGQTAAPPGTGFTRAFAARLRPDLSALDWQIELDDGSIGRAHGVVADGPGTVVLVGESRNPGDSDLTDVLAVKLDATTGAILWQKTFRLAGTNEWGTSIALAPENTLLVGARIGFDIGQGLDDGWLLKIASSDGHLLWQRRYGGPEIDYFTMAIPRNIYSAVEGFLVVGSRVEPGKEMDLWLLATDGSGAIPACTGLTEISFTQAVEAQHHLSSIAADAELVPLTAGYFGAADVTAGYSFEPDSVLSPVVDCPCESAVDAPTADYIVESSTPQVVGGYIFSYLGLNGTDAVFDVTCNFTGGVVAPQVICPLGTPTVVLDAGEVSITLDPGAAGAGGVNVAITVDVP